MSKLKNIIRQLTDKDFNNIYNILMESNASKSAFLLKYFKERQLSDTKIMEELEVNANAYYTLRSRLNEKIEEYFVEAMESPKTDVLKKVSNINEIIYTKRKNIVIAALKKLEKELTDYDLTNELVGIYKNLKKFHINSPDHYHYSQLYNKHIAFTLALDKAEDLLGDYFKKFGHYYLTNDEATKLELSLFAKEIENVARLYQSHRLYVYKSALCIFHHIYIDTHYLPEDETSIQSVFDKIDKIFTTYESDIHYHHLKIVFDFLRFCYYRSKNDLNRAEIYYSDLNESAAIFMSNYGFYTFPTFLLTTKIQKQSENQEKGFSETMLDESLELFSDFEADPNDVPKFATYGCYRALSYFYAGKYDQAVKVLNTLLDELYFKKYPDTQAEIKCLLAVQYCFLKEYDQFNQLMSSIQRQIRLQGKQRLDHLVVLTKVLKTSVSSNSPKMKLAKMKMQLERLDNNNTPLFSIFKILNFNEKVLKALSEI